MSDKQTLERQAAIAKQLKRLPALGFKIPAEAEAVQQWIQEVDHTTATIRDISDAIDGLLRGDPLYFPNQTHLINAIDQVRRDRVSRERERRDLARRSRSTREAAIERAQVMRPTFERLKKSGRSAEAIFGELERLGNERRKELNEVEAPDPSSCGLCSGTGIHSATPVAAGVFLTSGGSELNPGDTFGVCCRCQAGRRVHELQAKPKRGEAAPMPVFEPGTMEIPSYEQ